MFSIVLVYKWKSPGPCQPTFSCFFLIAFLTSDTALLTSHMGYWPPLPIFQFFCFIPFCLSTALHWHSPSATLLLILFTQRFHLWKFFHRLCLLSLFPVSVPLCLLAPSMVQTFPFPAWARRVPHVHFHFHELSSSLPRTVVYLLTEMVGRLSPWIDGWQEAMGGRIWAFDWRSCHSG